MSRLARYFADYSQYHRSQGNKVTHYVGIPLIVVGLLGLLSQGVLYESFGLAPSLATWHLRLDGGVVLLVLGVLWYLWLDWKIALPFSLVLTGFYFIGRALPVSMSMGLFLLGWIFQGVGHFHFEKNSPAFAKNLMHLLTGPIWIFARAVGYQPGSEAPGARRRQSKKASKGWQG